MPQASATYRERIIDLVEPVVESEGMELVDVECLRMKTRWLVRIFIDKEKGVTVDDCSDVSRQAGDLLDVHDIPPGPYTLEVSSPGLDRPLVRDRDFEKYRGSTVRVRLKEKLDGAQNLRGTLTDYRDGDGGKTIVLSVEGRDLSIPREMVSRARLEYEFEEDRRTAREPKHKEKGRRKK